MPLHSAAAAAAAAAAKSLQSCPTLCYMVIRSRLISAGQKKEKTASDFQIVHYSDIIGFE